MSTKPEYSALVKLTAAEEDVWVTLYDGLFICLIAEDSNNKNGFLAKFIPCAKNSRVYNISYDKVKALRKGKYDGS